MKESFRSTRPITEYALNVLYRLQPPAGDPDHAELVRLGLIEEGIRDGLPWWHVRFNRVDGPMPEFRSFNRLEKQVNAVAQQLLEWIRDHGVKPCDITIVCNDRSFQEQLQAAAGDKLDSHKCSVIVDPKTSWRRDERTVVISTAASYKGFEAEIVVVAGVERFIGDKRILANTLYVAMTRARSVLAIFAYQQEKPKPQAVTIINALEQCWNTMMQSPPVEGEFSRIDEYENLVERIGKEHADWLAKIWRANDVRQEPLVSADGERLGDPLFWFDGDGRRFACFGRKEPPPLAVSRLEDRGVAVIRLGQLIDG